MIAVYDDKKTNWKIETSNKVELICKYQESNCITCKYNKQLVNLEHSTSDFFNQERNSLRSNLCVEIRIV